MSRTWESIPTCNVKHWCWPQPADKISTAEVPCMEMSRITGTIGVDSAWITQDGINAAKAVMAATGCELGVVVAPFHGKNGAPKPLSPFDYAGINAALMHLAGRLQNINVWLGWGVRPTAYLIDDEIFQLKDYDAAGDAAIMAARSLVWSMVGAITPGVLRIRYGRGPINTAKTVKDAAGKIIGNWNPNRHYDGTEAVGLWGPVAYAAINPEKTSAMLATTPKQEQGIAVWVCPNGYSGHDVAVNGSYWYWNGYGPDTAAKYAEAVAPFLGGDNCVCLYPSQYAEPWSLDAFGAWIDRINDLVPEKE